MELPSLSHPLKVVEPEEVESRQVEFAPNNTLYISNLNEKVPIDDLKDTLFNIFEDHG